MSLLFSRLPLKLPEYSEYSRANLREELTRLMQEGQPSDTAKIPAAELLGKHHGIFAERVVIEPPEKTSEELAAEINQILKAAGGP